MNKTNYHSIYSRKTKTKLALSFGLFVASFVLLLFFDNYFTNLNDYSRYFIHVGVPAFFLAYFILLYEKLDFVIVSSTGVLMREKSKFNTPQYFEFSYDAVNDVFIDDGVLMISLKDGDTKKIFINYLSCQNPDGLIVHWREVVRLIEKNVSKSNLMPVTLRYVSETQVSTYLNKKNTPVGHKFNTKIIILLLLCLMVLLLLYSIRNNG